MGGFQGGICTAAEHRLDQNVGCGALCAHSECLPPGLLSDGSCETVSTLPMVMFPCSLPCLQMVAGFWSERLGLCSPHFWQMVALWFQHTGVQPRSKIADKCITESSLQLCLMLVQDLQSSGESVCSSVACMEPSVIILKESERAPEKILGCLPVCFWVCSES